MQLQNDERDKMRSHMSRDGFYGEDQSEARRTGMDRVINVIEINVELEAAFTILKVPNATC